MSDYSQLMSLEKKPSVRPPAQPATFASLLANQQTSKEANQKGSKPTNQQTSKTASKFTSKEANQQTTKEKKKYGTYLREESISAIQMLAIQTKRKDHEVLQEIVDVYFVHQK